MGKMQQQKDSTKFWKLEGTGTGDKKLGRKEKVKHLQQKVDPHHRISEKAQKLKVPGTSGQRGLEG